MTHEQKRQTLSPVLRQDDVVITGMDTEERIRSVFAEITGQLPVRYPRHFQHAAHPRPSRLGYVVENSVREEYGHERIVLKCAIPPNSFRKKCFQQRRYVGYDGCLRPCLHPPPTGRRSMRSPRSTIARSASKWLSRKCARIWRQTRNLRDCARHGQKQWNPAYPENGSCSPSFRTCTGNCFTLWNRVCPGDDSCSRNFKTSSNNCITWNKRAAGGGRVSFGSVSGFFGFAERETIHLPPTDHRNRHLRLSFSFPSHYDR